jgi:hypothetical protein
MEKIGFDSPSVQSYLTILQSVISRMASNSAACKTWCVSLVSAIVVIIADKGKPDFVWVSVIPIALFFFLDLYYLSLERLFREVYNDFIRKLHIGTAMVEDVFSIAPKTGTSLKSLHILKSCGSIAIWPFYTLLAVMLLVVRAWVL